MEVVNIRKGSKFYFLNDEVRLENEIVISEIVYGMVHGQPYKQFQKIPHILLITGIPITN
jgi:hypothetical protein